LQGVNGSVFAYGQTGSGKTYSMIGDNKDLTSGLQNESGILIYALNELFQIID
jgi:hypothetical protein